MKPFNYFLILLCMHISIIMNASITKVVPFVYDKHAKMLAMCAQQHYGHIFSNSPQDPRCNRPIQKYLYGAEQAKHFGILCNHLGQIKNKDASITTVQVLELDYNPIGYIKYSAPYLNPKVGTIHQLAIVTEHTSKDLGKLLVWNALDNFYKNETILYALLATTTQEVGEKFYAKKLKFSFLGTQPSSKYPDETLYQWGAKIR
jgi:hypothetical protein